MGEPDIMDMRSKIRREYEETTDGESRKGWDLFAGKGVKAARSYAGTLFLNQGEHFIQLGKYLEVNIFN